MRKALHVTPNIGQMRSQQFSGHMYTQPGGRTWHTVLGHRRVVLGDTVNSQELWSAAFMITLVRVLPDSQEAVITLFG